MDIQYPKTKQEKKDRRCRAKEDRRIIKKASERAKKAEEERKKAIENFKPTTILRKKEENTDQKCKPSPLKDVDQGPPHV